MNKQNPIFSSKEECRQYIINKYNKKYNNHSLLYSSIVSYWKSKNNQIQNEIDYLLSDESTRIYLTDEFEYMDVLCNNKEKSDRLLDLIHQYDSVLGYIRRKRNLPIRIVLTKMFALSKINNRINKELEEI
jgi:hypothetical protein